MARIAIDIISDTICPWCFIGKRRLERAIATFQASSKTQHTFDIKWHPFYLGPPTGPVQSKLQRYEEKFGAAKVAQIIPYMKQVGEQEGIHFSYDGPIGPTYLSHRMLQYVQDHEPAKTDAVVMAIFKAYFEECGNIFEMLPLLEIVSKAETGIDMAAAKAFISDPAGRGIIDKQVMDGQKQGVNGVPDFTIAGRYHLNGAQEPEAFLRIFEQLASRET
ncbi:thioredoxin-like protein [Protomyces lactucae-debilis]|uniref:Thioredoxin-like protein n=1 Tax=Protomyces lactucae-debilis TaxID=2754530 RepID=A0A1Y2FUY5_PROLT|nr:thioredoxin-like protein [Protomyces lactucae-debilis]ORY87821.1 thioredoxin-like protein [Protomyces lactucae-debilis]